MGVWMGQGGEVANGAECVCDMCVMYLCVCAMCNVCMCKWVVYA